MEELVAESCLQPRRSLTLVRESLGKRLFRSSQPPPQLGCGFFPCRQDMQAQRCNGFGRVSGFAGIQDCPVVRLRPLQSAHFGDKQAQLRADPLLQIGDHLQQQRVLAGFIKRVVETEVQFAPQGRFGLPRIILQNAPRRFEV